MWRLWSQHENPFLTGLRLVHVIIWIGYLWFQLRVLKPAIGDDPNDNRYILFIYALSMSMLRYTSCSLQVCGNHQTTRRPPNEEDDKPSGGRVKTKNKKEWYTPFTTSSGDHANPTGIDVDSTRNWNFMHVLCYVFYLPLFFVGPLYNFDQFHLQVCIYNLALQATVSNHFNL